MHHYSDRYSKKLYIILSDQWFSLTVIKLSQKVSNSQHIDEKMRVVYKLRELGDFAPWNTFWALEY